MKAADLPQAQSLLEQRDAALRLAGRLEAGEPLRLMLGDGAGASEIVLSPAYRAALCADIGGGLSRRIADLAGQLAGLGVDVG